MARRNNKDSQALLLLILAAIVFFVLNQFPLGRMLQWPFVIITTYVHEMGHGLMALLLGGNFVRMEIFTNASGLAWFSGVSSGLPAALVAAAGLLAPAVCGYIFIRAGTRRRSSSNLLLIFSIIILLSCLFWIRSWFGFLVMAGVALGFLWLSRHGGSRIHQFLIQFIGVHMLVDTCTRTMRYLFTSSANVGEGQRHTDTAAIADNLGGSYLLWALLIGGLSVFILALSLKRAYLK